MFTLFFCFLGTLRSCFQTRAALHLEILALRHQINVLRRSLRGRVRLTEVDRLLWAGPAPYGTGQAPAGIRAADLAGATLPVRARGSVRWIAQGPHGQEGNGSVSVVPGVTVPPSSGKCATRD